MKRNKTSWSIKGANNLAKILAEKASRELTSTIKTLLDKGIKEEKLEEIIEKVGLTAAEANRKTKENKTYKHKRASIPFSNSAVTNGRKAIQKMLNNKCLSKVNLSF